MVEKPPFLPPCHRTSAHARRPLPRSASNASPPAEEPRHPRPAPVTQRRRQSRRAPNFFPASTPLETLAPAPSRPYKKAPSTPQNSTPLLLPIPTFLSSSLPRKRPSSASVRRHVLEDSGRRWSFCWCKVEERSSRRRSASPPLSSSSPASSCAVEPYTAVAGESLPVSELDDARAPLDSNPTATYRFGIVK
jgi:hypothetical protein